MKLIPQKKIQAIALFAFMLALLAISISSTTTTTGNNTTGITNHANLTNLNWANAGHTIDSNVEVSGNHINNVSKFESIDLLMYYISANSIGTKEAGFIASYISPKVEIYANSASGLNRVDVTSTSTDFVDNGIDMKNHNINASGGITLQSFSYDPYVYFDNFTSDNYTDVGTKAYVNISETYLFIKGYRSATDERSYTDISTLSDESWIFNFTFRNIGVYGANGIVDFGLWSSSANRKVFTGDSIFVTSTSGSLLTVRYIDGGVAGGGQDITVTNGATYYLTIERLNSTSIRTSVYSDITRSSHVVGSPKTQTIPVTITGLDVIQVSNYNDNAAPTNYMENWFDNFDIHRPPSTTAYWCLGVSTTGSLTTTPGSC